MSAAADTGPCRLRAGAEQVPLIIGFEWTLLRADGGYITSDRGVAIHDPEPPGSMGAQELCSSTVTQTTIPLSDHECLLIRPALHRSVTERALSPKAVEPLNLRAYGFADRHVFGATGDLVAVRSAAKRRPADVIRPRPSVRSLYLT
jgi:hypothetical protein